MTLTLDLLYIEAELRKLTAQVPTMDSPTVDHLDDELSGLLDELEQAIAARQRELDGYTSSATRRTLEILDT